MSSVVCTLFEGHYHYGVAGLVNSLHKNGFKGQVFAGYKGTLPKWSSFALDNFSIAWNGCKTLIISGEIQLHFLPIETEFHLTNYKPFFMLKLFEDVVKDVNSIVYFDPDIVIKCNWSFFENWMTHGVSLVHEIINNDMPPTHPLRMEWTNVIRSANREVTRKLYSYINGGFCGISRNNIEFLITWIAITTTAIQLYNLTPDQWAHNYDRTYILYAQDQDTLNIAAMCSESPISEMGPEAMDFINGGFTMSHSVGSPKPWKKKYLLEALKGKGPSATDKQFWSNQIFPLKVFSNCFIKFKRGNILFASFIARFYSRR